MRKIKTAVLAAIVGAVAAPAFAVNVNWTDWQSGSTGAGILAEGVMTVDGTDIDVEYSNSAGSIFGLQTSGGTDYWQNGRSGRNAATSGYTSTGTNGNDNIPTGVDIIQAGAQATHTFRFLTEVQDIYLSFVSINRNSLTFDTPFELLSITGGNLDGNGTDSNGYWGNGGATLTSTPSTYSLTASGETHGTLFIAGAFTELSFTTSASETWHGFTVGAASTPSEVPLPAAGLMLMAGLGAVAGLRRTRR